MLKPLDLILIKADWANEHIRYLDIALRTAYKEQPKFLDSEVNSQTGKQSFYVSKVPEIPPLISLITADVLSNLRSSLDHLAYGIVAAATIGGIPLKPKNIYFPVACSSNEYMSSKFRRKIDRLEKKAIKRIDIIKPYKGGNDLLWQLHELNNLAKHRLLLTV